MRSHSLGTIDKNWTEKYLIIQFLFIISSRFEMNVSYFPLIIHIEASVLTTKRKTLFLTNINIPTVLDSVKNVAKKNEVAFIFISY
jgi:hypothetical protein